MATTTITVAIGRWANRATLDYVAPNALSGGKRIDANGNISGTAGFETGLKRLPYKTESTNGTTYIMYDDDTQTDVAIIRIVEG